MHEARDDKAAIYRLSDRGPWLSRDSMDMAFVVDLINSILEVPCQKRAIAYLPYFILLLTSTVTL
jgi:hypothetical protein